MRVILKPAGLIILCLSLLTLAAVAFGYGKVFGVQKDSGQLISNGSFELPFVQNGVVAENQKALIDGKIGADWFDNSGWGNVTLVYARETEKPYRGESCQRIEFKRVDGSFGRLQFAQAVDNLIKPGGKFKATAYVRSSKPTQVEFGMRVGAVEGKYEVTPTWFKIGTEWTKVEVEQTVQPGGTGFLMMNCDTPGITLWIDEATLVQVGA